MSKNKITKLFPHCKDLTGQRFCRLVALEPVGKDKQRTVLWKCKCDCGEECAVRSHDLISGKTKSCGCLQKESRGVASITHGMSRSPEYQMWAGMLQRCENPKVSGFKDYGGRGIKVCKRWHKFENFYEDMGERPEGMTLDRSDNDGNYQPRNCRWATRHEQQMNKRPISKGPRKQRWFRAWKLDQCCQYLSNSQSQFARVHGLDHRNISACLLGKRKSHKGWVFKRILSLPARPDSMNFSLFGV